MNISSFYYHFKKNLQLSIPISLGQIGQILINLSDNIMVGSLGKINLAAVSLASSVFVIVMVFGWGISSSLSPLSTSINIKNNNEGSILLYNGLIISLMISIIMYLLILCIIPILPYLGQSKNIIEKTIPFLNIISLSMIPWFLFESLRKFSEGLALTLPGMIVTWLGVFINILFNYLFINGILIFPKLGILGSAYATFITRLLMFISLYIIYYNHKKMKKYVHFNLIIKNKLLFNFKYINKILILGIPVGLQMLFEVGAFAIASFIIGFFGPNHLAAHQIVISLVSTTYMLSLGFSVAATIRISNKYSLKEYNKIKDIGQSIILMSSIFMLICGIIFIFLRYKIPLFYINNQEVILISSNLIIIAALFQLSDGIQSAILGALRGINDVKFPMWISLFSYWIIGIPLGAFLSIYMQYKSLGVWLGLGLGLSLSSIFLYIRYKIIINKLIKN